MPTKLLLTPPHPQIVRSFYGPAKVMDFIEHNWAKSFSKSHLKFYTHPISRNTFGLFADFMLLQGYVIVLSKLLWLQCVALMDLSSLPSIRCGIIKNKDAICHFLSTFFMNIHTEEFGFSLLCKTSASLSIWGICLNNSLSLLIPQNIFILRQSRWQPEFH